MRINAKVLQLGALAALFVAPVVVAWVLYSGGGSAPYAEGSHGLLVNPPAPLGEIALPRGGDAGEQARLTGRWSFLYLSRGDCLKDCEEALIRMRQARLALGKDANRVQRVFVPAASGSGGGRLEQAFPGMVILPAGMPGHAELLERIGARGTGEILLVDPRGNLVLSYPPDLGPDGLFRDARHLLKLSKIG